jgi:LysM repeat protein
MLVLTLVALGVPACYKNAGENVQPTSNRVDLSDIAPTTTTLMISLTPTAGSPVTTLTLVPTITPPGATVNPTFTPTSTLFPPSPGFTPTGETETPTEPAITTPGMSDIQSSSTPAPTLDPAFQPTPTAIPVEENPCIHVVQPGDTLFSIARNNEVELNALVAANPSLLGGSEFTPLQIGWQLQIPGCTTGEPEPTPTVEGDEPGETGEATVVPGAETTHEVQAGDTIYSIARQYGVSPEAIIAANNLVNPSLIYPGQTLIIPAAEE